MNLLWNFACEIERARQHVLQNQQQEQQKQQKRKQQKQESLSRAQSLPSICRNIDEILVDEPSSKPSEDSPKAHAATARAGNFGGARK